jgi:hypothetical protein
MPHSPISAHYNAVGVGGASCTKLRKFGCPLHSGRDILRLVDPKTPDSPPPLQGAPLFLSLSEQQNVLGMGEENGTFRAIHPLPQTCCLATVSPSTTTLAGKGRQNKVANKNNAVQARNLSPAAILVLLQLNRRAWMEFVLLM